jgi:SAM-dependent methyltransferase
MSSATPLPFELEGLSKAVRYADWIFETCLPWAGRRILEVGAGIGTLSRRFLCIRPEFFAASEPDPVLRAEFERQLLQSASGARSVTPKVHPHGFLELGSLRGERLDTVVSFNVLEHVEDDRGGIREALELLKDSLSRESSASPPRRLVLLVPAHSWLFGSLDESFGHFRRYDPGVLTAMVQEEGGALGLSVRVLERPFNFLGIGGWWFSGRVLRRRTIDAWAIRVFDALVPLAKALDFLVWRVLRLELGQSRFLVATVSLDLSPSPRPEGANTGNP